MVVKLLVRAIIMLSIKINSKLIIKFTTVGDQVGEKHYIGTNHTFFHAASRETE